MINAERRQDEQEYSLACIGRLGALQRALKIAADQDVRPRSDQSMRPILEGRSGRARPEFETLAVGAEYGSAVRELLASIEEAVESIATRCGQPWQRGQIEEGRAGQGNSDGEVWTFGAVHFLVKEFPILRGSIEFRKTEPVAPGLPDVVVEYLVTVPGTRDQLVRESHGHWGYHYHYLDNRSRRSDTLLTFDRNSPGTAAMPTLCWERHSEGQKFKARAAKWGTNKRESVYSVCLPDTLRFRLDSFKRPGSDAEVVWPPTVKVLNTDAA